MVILEDTRNQIGKHKNINEQLQSLGHKVLRCKLLCGDYALATSQSVCIDTKQGLQEVAGNLVQSHDRFREECFRAQEAGIRLVVLIEEAGFKSPNDVAHWINPRLADWHRLKAAQAKGYAKSRSLPKRPPIDGARLAAIMQTMRERYGVEWAFCDKSLTGHEIARILGYGA